jgi:hypothetical protein
MAVRHPYLLTFGQSQADIWLLRFTGVPEHISELSEFGNVSEGVVDDIERIGLVIDPELQIIIFPHQTSPSRIQIFSLVDGTLLHDICLSESVLCWPCRYIDGYALFASDEDDDAFPPHGASRITTLRWPFDGEEMWQQLGLPQDLQHREIKRTITTSALLPVLRTRTGDVVGASSEIYADTMDVLLWRGAHLRPDQDPSSRLKLSISSSIPNADLMGPESSALVDDNSFIFCVYERASGAQLYGRWCHMVIYTINLDSLSVRWRAEPILGHACAVHFVPALGKIIAIGEHRAEQSDGWVYHPGVTWIAVLDKDTGMCLRMEVIDQHIGVPVVTCTLSQSEETPVLVVVFKDGDYIAADLRTFADRGLERYEDDGGLKVKKAFESPVSIQRAVVGDGVLVVLLSEHVEQSGCRSRTHCVVW